MLGGPHESGSKQDDGQIHPLQALKDHADIPPDAPRHPPLPAHVKGMPRPIRLRYIPPRCARAQAGQSPFQGIAIADLGWPATPALLRGSQAVDRRKLFVRQIIEAMHGYSSWWVDP
jgi:hypothetical protein